MKKIFLIGLFIGSSLSAQEILSGDSTGAIAFSQPLLTDEQQKSKCSVFGSVIDQSTQEPIGNVKILVMGTKFAATTGSDGRFTLTVDGEGYFQLKMETEGYEPQIINNVYFKDGSPAGFFKLNKLYHPPSDFVEVDKQPVPVQGGMVMPQYPDQARKDEREGTVWVKLWIDEKGNVRDAKVLKSSHEIFEQPSIEAALKWKFEPAILHGKPVAVWVTIPFKFKLDQDVTLPEDLDTQPEPIKSVRPKYPQSAKQIGLEGEFWINAVIDEHGKVLKVKARQMHVIDHKSIDVTITDPQHLESEDASQACAEMSKEAVEAAQQWKFSPGMKDGKAVKSKVIIPIKYSLKDAKEGKKK